MPANCLAAVIKMFTGMFNGMFAKRFVKRLLGCFEWQPDLTTNLRIANFTRHLCVSLCISLSEVHCLKFASAGSISLQQSEDSEG